MKKIVYNCTEGGAKIQGCEQMLLKDMIDKHCTKKINKSKIKDLLSYADNGNKLIEKVIPLLKDDIKNLDEIIIQSRRGLAANKGLKNLMQRKNHKKLLPAKKERKFDQILKQANQKSEGNFIKTNMLFYDKVIKGLRKSRLKNVMILSYKNFMASESAHIASKMNPLVNVAIYGASRQIQGRDLKVNEGINNFLKNSKDALIRIKRNTLILDVAKNAAKSLKTSYKDTYKLLKEYNKTKDNNVLINTEIEEINLDDAEEYFAAGNWAHPLVDALNVTKNLYIGSNDPLYIKAKLIYKKATKMKNDAIQKAKKYEKENSDHDRKLIKYNDLLEEAKKIGRDNKEKDKFKEALALIKKASELMPSETEARWGLATAYHHSGNIDKSLKEYKNLIKDFPDNNMFQFEYGQVLLTNGKIKEGLIQISEVMEKTEDYDHFFSKLGDIYMYLNMNEEALSAYNSYLKKYPFDFKVYMNKGDCLSSLGRNKLAEKAWKKALEIKPDYKRKK